MKSIEPIIYLGWLICIFLSQHHVLTQGKIKHLNKFGIFPGFHLFAPRPFLGHYIIRYTMFNQQGNGVLNDEVPYLEKDNFINSNRRLVKFVIPLCQGLSKTFTKNNYLLLLNLVKEDAIRKQHSGRIKYYIIFRYKEVETLKFESKTHYV